MQQTNDERNCKRKLKHPNYLSALVHAMSLWDDSLVIYPCSVCGGLHLGHPKAGIRRLTPRQTQEKMAALRKRVRTHQRLAEEHQELVEELVRELVQLSSLAR